jgi:hypothetical protein
MKVNKHISIAFQPTFLDLSSEPISAFKAVGFIGNTFSESNSKFSHKLVAVCLSRYFLNQLVLKYWGLKGLCLVLNPENISQGLTTRIHKPSSLGLKFNN